MYSASFPEHKFTPVYQNVKSIVESSIDRFLILWAALRSRSSEE